MYNLRVLVVSLIFVGSLSELPKTFTLGIKLKLRHVQTEKLKIIVSVVIIGANVVRAHERFPCGGRRSGH